jgi:hypothetical protein
MSGEWRWGRVRVGVGPVLLPPIPTFPRQGEGVFTSPCRGGEGE